MSEIRERGKFLIVLDRGNATIFLTATRADLRSLKRFQIMVLKQPSCPPLLPTRAEWLKAREAAV